MSMTSPLRLPILLTVILILSSISALGYGAVSMDATAGFDGAIMNQAWAPVTVKLANASVDSVKGEIVVEQPGYGGQGLILCSAKVDLPANSKKLYHVYIKPPQYGGNLSVSLVDSGRTLVQKDVSVTTVNPGDRLVVTVGSRPSPLSFLANTPVPQRGQPQPASPYGASPSAGSGRIVVGTIAPGELPDRVGAYQAATAVVLQDFNPSSASPKALKALSMWVACGGLLIVPGGPDYKRLQNDFFNELLPVTVTGSTTASLGGSAGGLNLPSGTAAVTQSVLKQGIGKQLAGGQFPLVAVRSYVNGAVIFLAFDTQSGAFGGLNGQANLWTRLIMTDTTMPLIVSSQWNYQDQYAQYNGGQQGFQNTLSQSVEQNEALKTPSFTLLSIFLCAYLIVLVPVNYTFLRVKKRLELAWITTPAIVVLFTLGAYIIGYATKGNGLQTHQITFIEASAGSRYAAKITDASIFSPSRRTYDVEAADPYALCQILVSDRERTPVSSYVEESACTFERLGMAMWSSKTLESGSGEDLGGALEARINTVGGIPSGSITNNTTVDLKDCRVCFRGRMIHIGDVRHGQTVTIGGSSHKATADTYADTPTMESSFKDLIRSQSGSWSVPVLVGFSDAAPVFDLKDARSSGKNITCYAFKLEADKISVGASVSSTVAQAPGPVPAPMPVAPPTPRGPQMPIAGSPFSTSEFNSGADGWNISVWRSAAGPPATMSWDAGAGESGGGIRCEGSGLSDSDDRATREGGEIRKVISTAGRKHIQVYYSVRVNTLGGNYTGHGSGSGSVHVDHNVIDDQLTVYYSTNGGKSWTEAQNVARNSLLSTCQYYYRRRMINLVGTSACENNPKFALRFRWQVNGANDDVDLDNIVVTSS